MSHFGEVIRKLRMERGLTLSAVARVIGSHKGYVSGIENDRVNPPSVKMIRKFAELFSLSARPLARMAWVDKAPPILREDAELFLQWLQGGRPAAPKSAPSPSEEGALVRRDSPRAVEIGMFDRSGPGLSRRS